MRERAWSLVALLCAGAACGGPAGVTLRLGTVDQSAAGEARWVDLSATAPLDVTLAPGAQGGFHVWLLYATTGTSGPVLVQRLADREDADGTRRRVLTTEGTETITPGADGSWQVPMPVRDFMCPAPIGIGVVDQLLELTVRVRDVPLPGQASDDAPLRAWATGLVTPRCPTDASQAFCRMICSG